MLLQTNSYIVPAERRLEHQRLIRRFRQVMAKLGCDSFEVYEQVGQNWGAAESTGRFVQIMRFRDHRHQRQIQTAERNDPAAQALIAEFCELINLPYQQQQGLFAVGFYLSVVAGSPALEDSGAAEPVPESETAAEDQKAPEQEPESRPGETENTEPTEPETAAEAVPEMLDAGNAKHAEQEEIAPVGVHDQMPADQETPSQPIAEIEPESQDLPAPPHTGEEHTLDHEQAAETLPQEPREFAFERHDEADSEVRDEEPRENFDIESIEQEPGGFEQSTEERDRRD